MIEDIIELQIPNHEDNKNIILSLVDNAISVNWYERVSNEHTTSIRQVENPWIKIPSVTDFVIETYKNKYDQPCYTDFWLNIYHPGGIQGEHDHAVPGLLGSWCYFVDVPKDSGKFVFTKDKSEYGKEGTVVLFPTTMLHEVTENKSKQTRVTVAGNIFSC